MNEAEDLRAEATRLLRSVDSMPLADARDIAQHAARLIGLADRIDQGSQIMTDQPTLQQAMKHGLQLVYGPR